MTLRKLALLGAFAVGLTIGALVRWRGVDWVHGIPPWPRPGRRDPLENTFGADADHIHLLAPEGLEILRNGGEVVGTPLGDLDFAEPGERGLGEPSGDEWAKAYTFHETDGTWHRSEAPVPGCGVAWILHFEHEESVQQCEGYYYYDVYRATLLRAIAEAYAQCREHSRDCQNAKMWLLWARWDCGTGGEGPTVRVRLKFAVVCVGD
jgi:hypothetical protein